MKLFKSYLTPSWKSVARSWTWSPASRRFTFTQFLNVFAWQNKNHSSFFLLSSKIHESWLNFKTIQVFFHFFLSSKIHESWLFLIKVIFKPFKFFHFFLSSKIHESWLCLIKVIFKPFKILIFFFRPKFMSHGYL